MCRLWSILKTEYRKLNTLVTIATLLAITASVGNPAVADEAPDPQVQAAERFLSVLEKNPRRGTALDRVYGHHVEYGTLDAFIATLTARTTNAPADGTAWMLLGLFESQRGADANAVAAFQKAEAHRPDDPLPAFYLAQAQLRIGQNDEAVAALERALARKPQRTDLLEIYQQLGRIHQRAQRTVEAMQVWQRLEAQFPDDPRVLEQVAVTLTEEGSFADALPRFERLAELTQDDYRRVMYRVEAAQLTIRLGQREAGVAGMERVLTELDPDSWLHRDVRRRIDDVFLRSGDQDGLVAYYLKWLAAHPDDVEGMARLARFLARSARIPEATDWMNTALRLAPSRTDLRKAFIDQLVDDQRITEARKQYEELLATAPGNADFLREWGRLVLKDKTQDIDARRAEAARIWKQILDTRPDDALTAAQVADLFRQSGMAEAQALYEKAVELAPDDPQYREFLGEFHHIQKQPELALETWASIATDSRRTADNVARLAEVYNSFGYLDQAVAAIADACTLAPEELTLQLRAAEYHTRAAKFDDALKLVDAAAQLAVSEEETEAVIKQRIETLQTAQRLDEETARLAEAINANAAATAADWTLLARYHEAARDWTEATAAVEAGLRLDPSSIPALAAAARIAESSGNSGQAAEINRRLADTDRRSRGDHLMNVARLEAQMGRSADALKAAQELVESAPGNTDHYEYLAQLCFRLGKSDQGLDAIRKAVRINPNEPHLIMSLANALADQLRTEEAIEVYWRAFDKSDSVEDKTGLVMKLTPLYTQIGQFDTLIQRLDRDRKEEDKRRELTICLAQAHQTSGDYGTARTELESLLSEDTRDTNLLQQLSKLCEVSGDIDAAISYQRQLVAIAPGHETEFPLVALLNARGDRDEARDILVRLTAREDDPMRLLKSLDALLLQNANEAVISITEPLLSRQREDWELLYREGVAWAQLDKKDEARTRFERILAINLPHDTQSLATLETFKRAQAKARSENLKGNVTQAPVKRSPLQMLVEASAIQRVTGLSNEPYYISRPTIWVPAEFGTSRMAAFGWLLRIESDAAPATAGNAVAPDSLVGRLTARANAPDAPINAIYDRMYVAQLLSQFDELFDFARTLAVKGGLEEQRYFLTSIQTRSVTASTTTAYVSPSAGQLAGREPLSPDDIQLMLKCHAAVQKASSGQDGDLSGQTIVASDGTVYVVVNGVAVRIGTRLGSSLLSVLQELQLAGQAELAQQLLDEQLAAATTTQDLASAMSVLVQREQPDRLPELLDRWKEAASRQVAETPPPASARVSGATQTRPLAITVSALQSWMGQLGPAEDHAQLLSILDAALDIDTQEAIAARQVRQKQIRGPGPAAAAMTRVTWMHGKESLSATIDFPRSTSHISRPVITLLRQVHESFTRNDVVADLAAHLRKRLEQSSGANVLSDRLYLATALWWADEKDDAVELLKLVDQELGNDPDFRFELAEIFSARGDIEDALEIIESILPRDQQLLQRRELTALTLAERLGDHGRARLAAERLFGMRLDAGTQLALLDTMRRLGMNELAEALIARTERQSGNQPAALASLMTIYQSQGRTDRAKQIAHALLTRTVSPVTTMNTAVQNPLRYRSSGDATRLQALQVLMQTGELATLIDRLEEQLQRSPDSPRVYDQLIEFYGVAGKKDKIGTLLEQAVAVRGDSAVLRLQYAQHLEQSNKGKEACDQYLAVFKLKPDWITEDLSRIQATFTRAERMSELVEAVRSINVKSIRQPYYVINMAMQMMANEKTADAAVELLEKASTAFPGYRGNILGNVSDPRIWKSDKFFAIAKQAAIPTVLDRKANPWAGFDQVFLYAGNGLVESQFHQLLKGIANTERITELRTAIEQELAAQPDWYGGVAMLAVVELQSGKTKEAKERLELLLANETTRKSMPEDTCWMIGQELDRFQETRPLGVALLEQAVSMPTRRSRAMSSSPVRNLVTAYSQTGRKQEARDLLMKEVQSSSLSQYEAQYASYLRTESSIAAAHELVSLGYTVDAVGIYQKLLSDEAALRSAAQYHGVSETQYITSAKQGLAKAIAALDSADATAAISQLLSVSEKHNPGTPLLDLMLSTPGGTASSGSTSGLTSVTTIGGQLALSSMQGVSSVSTAPQPLDSGLLTMLTTLAKDDAVRAAIVERLVALKKEHPQDLSIAIAEAGFRQRTNDAGFGVALHDLAALIATQPLEELPAGKRANSRQRKDAAQFLPLWLIAKAALKDESLRAPATQLADRALAAARRQTGFQQSSLILLEWSQLLLDAGLTTDAEARLTELLEIATERPVRKKAESGKPKADGTGAVGGGVILDVRVLIAAADRTTVQPRMVTDATFATCRALPSLPWSNLRFQDALVCLRCAGHTLQSLPAFRLPLSALTTVVQTQEPAASAMRLGETAPVPPLTISQFRLAMTVARRAAENNMAALSRRAVREAMMGGAPVPDPAPVTNPSGSMTRIIRSTTTARAATSDSGGQFDAEVVQSLQQVLAKWTGDAYQPVEVYEMLKPLVFPIARPADVMLYANHATLRQAEVSSLGETLVAWAQRASKVDDLTAAIAEREMHAAAVIPALVLRTQLALAANDQATAMTLLTDLQAKLTAAPTPPNLQLACHSALPASKVPELETPAFVILKMAMMATVSDLSDRNSVVLTTGRLDELVNEHLVRTGGVDEIRKYFDARLAARLAIVSRMDVYDFEGEFSRFAVDAARVGAPLLALDLLGRAADLDMSQYANLSRDKSAPLACVVRHLTTVSPQQRYEIWRDWTLPTADRRTVRLLAQWVRPVEAPEPFLKLKPKPGTNHQTDLLCNLTELIAAAAEAGMLPELQTLTAAAMAEELPNADYLHALMLIHANDVEQGPAQLKKLLSTLPDRMTRTDNRTPPEPIGDYVVFRAAMNSPVMADVYFNGGLKQLTKPLREHSMKPLLAHLSADQLPALQHQTGGTLRPGDSGRLRHWVFTSGYSDPHCSVPAWWQASGSRLTHFGGRGTNFAFFGIPLEGTFDFSFESLEDTNAAGDGGYGGVIVSTEEYGVVGEVSSLDELDRFQREGVRVRGKPSYNQVTVRVVDGQMSYVINNRSAYSEGPTRTSPWLTLFSRRDRVSTFRNLRIIGQPTVPREVRLVDGDSLEGWTSNLEARNSRPMRRGLAEPVDPRRPKSSDAQRLPEDCDWRAANGELIGKIAMVKPLTNRCRIRYARPLQNGDVVRYEYLHQPGLQDVHPAIGRVAFLLKHDGVHTHWIHQPGWDDVYCGIPADNAIVEPEFRRGPAVLPLKSGDWNAVEVQMEDGRCLVSLNGELIFDRPNHDPEDTRFSFIRLPTENCRVRNAVLTGNWPESLTDDIRNNLLAVDEPLSDANQQIVDALLPESVHELEIPDVLAACEGKSNDEQYELLADWVLPSATRRSLRLTFRRGAVPPFDATPYSAAWTPIVDSPALRLIDAAQPARLEELRGRVESIVPDNARDQRSKSAYLLILDSYKFGPGQTTPDHVESLTARARQLIGDLQGLPLKQLSLQDRAAEILPAVHADREVRKLYLQHLRECESDRERKSRDPQFATIMELIEHDMALWQRISAHEPGHEEDFTPGPWQVTRSLMPSQQFRGHRPSTWLVSRSQIVHIAGLTRQPLYFQSPLTGQFEVLAESTRADADELLLQRVDGERPVAASVGDSEDAAKPPASDSDSEVVTRRWVVSDTAITEFRKDTEVKSAGIANQADPWLRLTGSGIGVDTTLRGIRFTGTPHIPDRVDLCAARDLTAWNADYFAESLLPASGSGSNSLVPYWTRNGDEIIGAVRPADTELGARESLLRYHRPLFEDGEIDFEVFRVAGEVEVHPAIGEIALLILSDGLKIHHLTHAQYETRGLNADNMTPVAGAATSLPLKDNDWNQMRLTLRGDQLMVSVNGTDAGSVTLAEPPAARFFGLFRWSDTFKCRARNFIYRGDWPKKLPK